MRVMALDPGGTTGIAVAKVDVERRKLSGVEVSQLPMPAEGEHKCAWELFNMTIRSGVDTLVMEDFRLFPGHHGPNQSGTIPMRLLAQMDLLFWLMRMEELEVHGPVPRIEKQMPGDRKVVTDDELRKLGVWTTPKDGGGPHAMDALRHLIVFARKLTKEMSR